MTQNLRHEAEVQRQHARIQLPAKVAVAGIVLETANWSNGGVALKIPEDMALPKELKEGSSHQAAFQFEFEGFSFVVPLDIEIRHIVKKKDKVVGCRFTNLTRRQISIIQSMVNAYISGEVVQIGDLLDVAARNNFSRPRTIPSADEGLSPFIRFRNRMRRSLRFTMVTAVFAALIAFIFLSIYERMFVITAVSGQVAADMISVDAPAGGKVFFKPIPMGTQISKGELLLTISSDTGNITSAESPCDCILKRRIFENNSLARKGEPVLEMVPPDAIPFIRAAVPNTEAVRLKVGDTASLSLPGHGRVTGKITAIQSGADLGANAILLITPEKPIPVSYVDNPVKVRVDTLNLF